MSDLGPARNAAQEEEKGACSHAPAFPLAMHSALSDSWIRPHSDVGLCHFIH